MLNTQMTITVDNEVDRMPEEPKTEKTTNYNLPMTGQTSSWNARQKLSMQSPPVTSLLVIYSECRTYSCKKYPLKWVIYNHIFLRKKKTYSNLKQLSKTNLFR